MKSFGFMAAGLTCLGFILGGCNQPNGMFHAPSSTLGTAATAAPAAGVPAATAPAPSAAPYVLSAESAGPYINFRIFNLGTTDLVVEKQHFALLSRNSREVIPYDRAGAVIDLPQPVVVKPNETLQGRAVFNKVNSPVGRRLVFKPDEVGTFADINPVTAVPGGGAPPAATGMAVASASSAAAPLAQ